MFGYLFGHDSVGFHQERLLHILFYSLCVLLPLCSTPSVFYSLCILLPLCSTPSVYISCREELCLKDAFLTPSLVAVSTSAVIN